MEDLTEAFDAVAKVSPRDARGISRNIVHIVVVNGALWLWLGLWALPLVLLWSFLGMVWQVRQLQAVARRAAQDGDAIGVIRSSAPGSISTQVARQFASPHLTETLDAVEEWSQRQGAQQGVGRTE